MPIAAREARSRAKSRQAGHFKRGAPWGDPATPNGQMVSTSEMGRFGLNDDTALQAAAIAPGADARPHHQSQIREHARRGYPGMAILQRRR